MTRSELITHIARSIAKSFNPMAIRGNNLDTETAQAALEAIEESGAKILLPVTEGQLVSNVVALDEKHVLRCTQEERDRGLYVELEKPD